MSLELFHKYDRRAVHDIFDPASAFTPSRGTWGLQGIVPIKKIPGDYVLFVTLGTRQGDHTFVEEIFDDGTFTWQSQPKNTLNHVYVQDLINHNSEINSVYLFLRTSKAEKYVYLGTLEYVTHDANQECPVYFMWRISQFDIEEIHKVLPNVSIKDRATGNDISGIVYNANMPTKGKMTLRNAPNRRSINRSGVSSHDFTGRNVDFEGEQSKNSRYGKAGEDLVVSVEKERLINAGRPDLADLVVATRNTIGNTAKFDVQSYEKDGSDRYIEVKTTTGSANNKIHISEAEVRFSEKHASKYYLYRVYNYNPITGNADYFVRPGAIDRADLSPTNYVF